MTHRKVLELAMNRAKDIWINNDYKASIAGYNDDYLNKKEVESWEVYEECCRLYMKEIKTLREQRRMKQ